MKQMLHYIVEGTEMLERAINTMFVLNIAMCVTSLWSELQNHQWKKCLCDVTSGRCNLSFRSRRNIKQLQIFMYSQIKFYSFTTRGTLNMET